MFKESEGGDKDPSTTSRVFSRCYKDIILVLYLQWRLLLNKTQAILRKNESINPFYTIFLYISFIQNAEMQCILFVNFNVTFIILITYISFNFIYMYIYIFVEHKEVVFATLIWPNYWSRCPFIQYKKKTFLWILAFLAVPEEKLDNLCVDHCLNKLGFHSPKDSFCQVWLKFIKWFQRTLQATMITSSTDNIQQ